MSSIAINDENTAAVDKAADGPSDTFVLVKSATGLVSLFRKDLASFLDLNEIGRLLAPHTAHHRAVGAESGKNGAAPQAVRIGRGEVAKISAGDINVIARRYRRGGLVARVNTDMFLRLPPWSSFRMFAELRVLSALSLQNVKVPRPVGAIVQPMIKLGAAAVYRGLILTEEIPKVENLLLAAVQAREPATGSADSDLAHCFSISDICARAGREARRCLDLGVFHPDLHPGNVLFDPAGAAFLIDFDRARLAYDRPLGAEWHRRTVARWNRSIEKHSLPAACRTAFTDGLYSRGS